MAQSISTSELMALAEAPAGHAARELIKRGLWHAEEISDGSHLFQVSGEVMFVKVAHVKRRIVAATKDDALKEFGSLVAALDLDDWGEDWDVRTSIDDVSVEVVR